MFRLSLLAIAVAMLAPIGLAQSAGETTSKAVIYIYRLEEAPPMDGRKPKLNLNGSQIASMPEESWFAIRVNPGRQVFKMRQKQSELEFEAKAGEVYYVQVSQIIAGYLFHQTARLIDAAQAKAWPVKLKPIEAKHLSKRPDLEFITELP